MKTELVQTIESIARNDRFPTRDVLMAYDQVRNARKTLEKINGHIDEMKKSPMAKNQAE